jgi:hypothetical protein
MVAGVAVRRQTKAETPIRPYKGPSYKPPAGTRPVDAVARPGDTIGYIVYLSTIGYCC